MHMDLRRMSLGQLAQLLQQVSRELSSRDRRPGGGGGGPGNNFNTYSNAGTYGYGGSPANNPYGNAQPPMGGGGGGFQKHMRKHRRPFQNRRPDFQGGSRGPGGDFNPGNEGGGAPSHQD